MDILLNPNVAYLVLTAAFLFTILAVLSPGTGLLEAGAVILLILAGYTIYNLPLNIWALVLLVVGVVPFIIAVRRSGRLVYLGISLVALVIGSSFLFAGDGWHPAVNPLLALITSTLVVSFLWIATKKILEADRMRPSHSLESLIGAVGEAKTDINDSEGSVQVSSELWSAHSRQPIPAGVRVRIVGRDGFMLEVEKLE
jgi:membrane-bound serine protease (ClpP class)